jgi:hypothetical protein
LENAVENVSYVIVDQGAMVIHAFSTNGRQVNLQFDDFYSFTVAIHKCAKWLPSGKILTKT